MIEATPLSGAARIAYLNGVFLPLEAAQVPIFDRGFNLGDGIYEVTAFVNRRLVDFQAHLARLRSSLAQVGIALEMSDAQWHDMHLRLIADNQVETGTVYVQITRGVIERDFVPRDKALPTVAAFVQSKSLDRDPRLTTGIAAALLDDLRWKRRDIKSISLLPQVLAKTRAHELGADEAILHENGVITEGGSTTVFALDEYGVLWTHPLNSKILPGVTRGRVLSIARARQLKVREEPIAVGRLSSMSEVFLTGATFFVVPVVTIDGRMIGSGRPGKTTFQPQRMRQHTFFASRPILSSLRVKLRSSRRCR